jgi:hypothetical protein
MISGDFRRRVSRPTNTVKIDKSGWNCSLRISVKRSNKIIIKPTQDVKIMELPADLEITIAAGSRGDNIQYPVNETITMPLDVDYRDRQESH